MEKLNRMELIQELKLRRVIREGIKAVKQRKKIREYDEILEESQLRSVIRKLLIKEGRGKPEGGHKSTAINRLEKLLHNIIDTLEDDFKELATDKDQRDSFRAHIINAVQNTFEPEELALQADAGKTLSETLKVKVAGIDDPRFIKIPRSSTEEEDKEEEEEFKRKEDPEAIKKGDFLIPGHDETGAEAAYLTYAKIETQIDTAYTTLKNEQDRETFEDYMIANLKIYFDQFEEEMSPIVQEPESAIAAQTTTPEAPPEMGPPPGADMAGMMPPMPPAKRDDLANEIDLVSKIEGLLEN
jgi:hypothetical protein